MFGTFSLRIKTIRLFYLIHPIATQMQIERLFKNKQKCIKIWLKIKKKSNLKSNLIYIEVIFRQLLTNKIYEHFLCIFLIRLLVSVRSHLGDKKRLDSREKRLFLDKIRSVSTLKTLLQTDSTWFLVAMFLER